MECAGSLTGGKSNSEGFREILVRYGKFPALDINGYTLLAEFYGTINTVLAHVPLLKIDFGRLNRSVGSLGERNYMPHVYTACVNAHLKMQSILGEIITLAKLVCKYKAGRTRSGK